MICGALLMKYYTYKYGSWSDQGDVREENQDAVLCCIQEDGDTDPGLKGAGLFLVADGMGGLSYGSQVSSYAASQFQCWWNEDLPQMIQAGRDSDEDIRELLEQEIWDINSQIYEFKEREGCRCGSTLSVLLLYNGRYFIENLGDSRIYRFQKSRLQQLTKDQSLVAKLVREQKLSPEEAKTFPKKNVLTMCLGMFQIPESGFEMGDAQAGDIFLLCSDGFHGCTEEGDTEAVLEDFRKQSCKEERPVQDLTSQLRGLILPGAAKDNVSIITVEVSKTGSY